MKAQTEKEKSTFLFFWWEKFIKGKLINKEVEIEMENRESRRKET